MIEFDDSKKLALEVQSSSPHGLVAVDGFSGSGKTTFAKRLAALLTWEVIHLDCFLNPQKGGFIQHLRYEDLGPKLLVRPMIVEGVMMLDVLQRLNIASDVFIYVKRIGRLHGSWQDEDECYRPVPDSMSNVGVAKSPLTKELISYHANCRPDCRAHYIFRRVEDEDE